MKKQVMILEALMTLFISGATVRAQTLDFAQLEQLTGPIALYPDPLIAEILPAASFPSEITLADRYVIQGGDPNQIPQQGWDPSVQALAHYANVLKWMDDNLAWTTQLGQVFQSQQADVMNAIQQLRAQAQNLGNLPTTPQESVVDDDGEIEIDPTDPDEMYVPSYDPNQIYYQSGVYCTFPYWLPIGVWLGYDWNWHNHGLVAWGPSHARPGNWWHLPPGDRHSYITGHPLPVLHAGAGAPGARGSWERGYEPREVYRSYAPPAAPRGPAPGIAVIHDAPTTFRSVPAFHSSAPAGGAFGGSQSRHEAVESSERGQASRAEIGGGSESHGGGGFSGHVGGGGGGGGGGGKHR